MPYAERAEHDLVGEMACVKVAGAGRHSVRHHIRHSRRNDIYHSIGNKIAGLARWAEFP